jgi:hypothetical protein
MNHTLKSYHNYLLSLKSCTPKVHFQKIVRPLLHIEYLQSSFVFMSCACEALFHRPGIQQGFLVYEQMQHIIANNIATCENWVHVKLRFPTRVFLARCGWYYVMPQFTKITTGLGNPRTNVKNKKKKNIKRTNEWKRMHE